jgi:Conserved in the green lineage and diatoms 27
MHQILFRLTIISPDISCQPRRRRRRRRKTICCPSAYTQDGYLLQKLAASNVGALLVVLFLLIRLYSGWGYVGSRLRSKVIEYEETGWYDGDFERKTEAEQKRDKFLFNDKVKPVVERLKAFTLATGGLWVASIIAFNVSLQYSKPLFDEYNPKLLERLVYDEKLAEKAAANSAGRPTYCDNRYYRAVAGGGQGCQ